MKLFDDSENKGGESPPTPATVGRKTERQATRQQTSDHAFRKSELSLRRTLVLNLFRQGPRTCDEIVQLGLAHQSASAAVNWLMRRGHIVNTGEKRRTVMGRPAIVWRYEETPVPLTRTRPTRRELERRINEAIDALRRDVVLESLCRLPIAILKGERTDV